MREEGELRQAWGLALSLLVAWGLLATARATYMFTEEPLARFSPAMGESDLFGYAAVLHRVDDSGDPQDFDHAIQNTRIVVGAPMGTYPGGRPIAGVNDSGALNNTGLVYVCPVEPGECEPLTGSGTGNDIRLFDYQGNNIEEVDPNIFATDENKEGQFMGATIVSSGKHIMICAPRWVSLDIRGGSDFDQTRGHGRCYVAGMDRMNFELLRPCTGGKPSSEGGESYCMAGTSAALRDVDSALGDVDSNSFVAYLGAPPYVSSHGAVFEYAVDDGVTPRNQDHLRRFDHFSEFLYGGFSVAVGKVNTTLDEIGVVSSLPKSNNYKGSVRVFNSGLGTEATMLGKQMGEYFGWTVATADLNGDGWDEVIVGAPLFSTPDKIEKGRVFIYKNNGTLDTDNPIILLGTASKGRYGSAIVNLGDINSDGFEDIAVSAPFVAHERGAQGTVYIYLGSGETVIDPNPDDVITALGISELLSFEESRFLKTFGYSLSSGVDVDANFNNDLVIGGYKTQTVIVLRTHSIADIPLSLSTNTDELFDYTMTDCSLSFGDFAACFYLNVSASFSGRGLDGRSLDVRVRVTEKAVSTGSRIFFLNSDNEKTNVFEGFLNFPSTGTLIKKSVKVYVENVIETDRRSPLSLVVSVSSLEREMRSIDGSQDIIDLRDIPLLNVFPENDREIQVPLFGCEMPEMCRPNLELTVNQTQYLDSQKQPTEHKEIVAGAVSFVKVLLDFQTLSDDAVGSRLALSLSPLLLGAPQSIRATIGTPLDTSQCQRNGEEGKYTCFVHPIFSSYEGKRQVEVIIAVSNRVTGMDCEDCTANFTISNRDDNIDGASMNTVSITFNVSAMANVRITELTTNPSSTQYEDTNELKTVITTKVVLTNSGPSTIPDSKLTILIPGQTAITGDFYYLYPERTTPPPSVICSGLDPDNLKLNSQNRRRKRRSVMERVWREVMGDQEGEERQTVHKRQETPRMVNCSDDRMACTKVVCNISDFSRKSLSVLVFSYVDNRFFRTQSGDFNFYIHADFEIITPFVDGPKQSQTSERLLVQEPKKGSSQPVPAWIYVVSGIGALLVLVLIIFLLYVFGCFKLRQKERIAKEREQMSQSAQGRGAGGATTEPASLDSKPDQLEEEEEELTEKLPESPSEKVAPEMMADASSETEL